jgi:hypothetical protein
LARPRGLRVAASLGPCANEDTWRREIAPTMNCHVINGSRFRCRLWLTRLPLRLQTSAWPTTRSSRPAVRWNRALSKGLVHCRHCGYGLCRTSTRTSARKIHYYRCLGSDAWRYGGKAKCNCRPDPAGSAGPHRLVRGRSLAGGPNPDSRTNSSGAWRPHAVRARPAGTNKCSLGNWPKRANAWSDC